MNWSKEKDLTLITLVMDGKEYEEVGGVMVCSGAAAGSRVSKLGVKRKDIITAALKGIKPGIFLDQTPFYRRIADEEHKRQETLFTLKRELTRKSFPVHVIEREKEIIIAGSFPKSEQGEFMAWLGNQFEGVRA